MLNSSKTFTSPVMDARGVDPKLTVNPTLLSWDAFVAAANEAVPNPPPCVDEFSMPDLVPDDGSSQCSDSPPCTPQTYDYLSTQHVRINRGSPYLPNIFVQSPNSSAALVLVEAPCAGGKPVKQKGDGYICSTCKKVFRRRDDTMRHIASTGMQVSCRYCGKPASGRKDGQHRHLLKNQKCLEVWEAGRKAGRFTERTVEDAYN